MAKDPTPVLIVSGNPLSAECDICIHMDGKDIAKVEDISMRVGALLGIYLVDFSYSLMN